MVDPSEIKPEAAGAAAKLRGYTILVVDDEEDVRTFLSALLEDAGARTFEAQDGDAAIARALELKPDLITLDLSMPGKDGVEAFVELRKTEGVMEIPICVITGHPEFRSVIYDRPVSPPEGYLNKPVDQKAVVSTIRRILGLREKKATR